MFRVDLRGLPPILANLPHGYQGQIRVGLRTFEIKEVPAPAVTTLAKHLRQAVTIETPSPKWMGS
jgi:hypothetical protein